MVLPCSLDFHKSHFQRILQSDFLKLFAALLIPLFQTQTSEKLIDKRRLVALVASMTAFLGLILVKMGVALESMLSSFLTVAEDLKGHPLTMKMSGDVTSETELTLNPCVLSPQVPQIDFYKCFAGLALQNWSSFFY